MRNTSRGTMTEKEKSRVSVLTLIIAVGLLIVFGGALIGPVLSTLLKTFPVTESDVGQVLGVYTLAAALALPVLGYLTDKIGRKKVLVPSLLINGLAGLACAFAPNFQFLLTARAIQGIGMAGMAPVSLVLIADFFSGLEKVEAMGKYSSMLAVAGVVAPFLGGVLAEISWKLPFLLYSFSIPLAIIIWIWLPSPKREETAPLKKYLKPFKKALKDPSTLGILFSNFLMFFLLYTIVTFIPILLSQNYGVSETVIGSFLAIQGLAVAIVSAKADTIAKVIPKMGAICVGFLVAGIPLFLLPVELPLLLLGVPIALFGIGRGLVQPQINTLVTDKAPEGRTGGLVSIFNIMKYSGQTAAPLALGVVLTLGGFKAVFWTAGTMAIVAFALALTNCAGGKREDTFAGLIKHC